MPLVQSSGAQCYYHVQFASCDFKEDEFAAAAAVHAKSAVNGTAATNGTALVGEKDAPLPDDSDDEGYCWCFPLLLYYDCF